MKIRHSGGSLCEVSDEYGEALLKSPDWTLVEASDPKPVRGRRSPKAAVEVKPEGALASEE